MYKAFTVIVSSVVISVLAVASPVVHKFELWGTASRTYGEKLSLYWGFTNGFFPAKGQSGVDLKECLEGIDYVQAIAMIDKFYDDHPEKWSRSMAQGFIEALTIRGGPCEGKNPL